MLKTIGAIALALLIGAVAGGWWMHDHMQDEIDAAKQSLSSAQSALQDQTDATRKAKAKADALDAKRAEISRALAATHAVAKAQADSFAKRLADAKARAASKPPAKCAPVLTQHLPASIGTAY